MAFSELAISTNHPQVHAGPTSDALHVLSSVLTDHSLFAAAQ
jgi:hypothetical protein